MASSFAEAEVLSILTLALPEAALLCDSGSKLGLAERSRLHVTSGEGLRSGKSSISESKSTFTIPVIGTTLLFDNDSSEDSSKESAD